MDSKIIADRPFVSNSEKGKICRGSIYDRAVASRLGWMMNGDAWQLRDVASKRDAHEREKKRRG